MKKFKTPQIEDYEKLIGAEAVDRIRKKARSLQRYHVAHVNATYQGGGVAEILISMTLLMDSLGIKTGWRILQAHPDFFHVTKKMHNALQGRHDITFSKREKEIYEYAVHCNAMRNHLEHDVVVIHDPQPLGLINHYSKHKMGPWLWRCHLDMSDPNRALWRYMRPSIDKYDASIFSLEEYRQPLGIPQYKFLPAIDPFIFKNQKLPEKRMKDCLKRYNIPTDLPLIVQVSRFDPWKDPEGVVKAFKIARKQVKARLVLIGNMASDDPEGQEIYASILKHRSDDIMIMNCGDDLELINTLQTKAAVVMQKSIKEGFGLTVTEALFKGTPVIGGNVGGIRHQIEDGVNGYLVSSVQEAAERIVQIVRSPDLQRRMGRNAKKIVVERFLLTRLLEQYLDVFRSLLRISKHGECHRIY